MKLVDILAREMKVWPDDCTHDYCVQDNEDCEVFFGGLAKSFWASQNAEDSQTAQVTRAQWQAAVDALKAESAPAWVGIGLPPVGTVCEAKTTRGWSRGTIIAHGLPPKENLAVWQEDGELIFWGVKEYFRQIRTPEQIAKQERSKACDKMYGVILDKIPQDRRNNGSDICEALYDAGYRKFEIVDN